MTNELDVIWKEMVVASTDVQSRCLPGEIRDSTKNTRIANVRLEM
jgi:hypothetical protein